MTSIEVNMALDELGGRLPSNQGPPTRADAVRLVNALRHMRAENEQLQVEVDRLRKRMDIHEITNNS